MYSSEAAAQPAVLTTRTPILKSNPLACAISIRSPPTKPRSSRFFGWSTNMLAIWRRCRGSFPDYPAPVVRNEDGQREMVMMRWGMPPAPKFGGPPVTNIRNTSSPHWRAGSSPRTGVWCRSIALRNMRRSLTPRPRKRTSFGSRSMMTGRYGLRWHLDRIHGRPGHQVQTGPRATSDLRFLTTRRTRWSSRSTPRRCR